MHASLHVRRKPRSSSSSQTVRRRIVIVNVQIKTVHANCLCRMPKNAALLLCFAARGHDPWQRRIWQETKTKVNSRGMALPDLLPYQQTVIRRFQQWSHVVLRKAIQSSENKIFFQCRTMRNLFIRKHWLITHAITQVLHLSTLHIKGNVN